VGITKKLRFIESTRTSFKIVICSKISPEFEGVPTTDFLPYVLNGPIYVF